MTSAIKQVASPNFGPRTAVNGTIGVRHVLMHYTGMKTCEAAVERLCDPAAKVSSHYVIDEDGTIYQLVAEEMRAWHAGVSFWHGQRDLNSTSVGIEIVNPGHEYGYRAFPEVQIDSVIALATSIMQRHCVKACDVLGHSDIAPGRKTDPGELFPWQQLAQHGVGLWPEDTVTLPGHSDMTGALRRLSEIGYAVPLTPELGSDILNADSAVTDIIAAFQGRYRQSKVDGSLDNETATRIAAVAVCFATARR
jgi:N-acetylmuramoyl-L-alanine amidase